MQVFAALLIYFSLLRMNIGTSITSFRLCSYSSTKYLHNSCSEWVEFQGRAGLPPGASLFRKSYAVPHLADCVTSWSSVVATIQHESVFGSNLRSVVLVWGPPSHGPRSKVLARELGVDT